jgi:hypothetical protein
MESNTFTHNELVCLIKGIRFAINERRDNKHLADYYSAKQKLLKLKNDSKRFGNTPTNR